MTITLHGTNGITTDGITLGSTAIASTGAEINILDGVTATATELNLIDGVTSTTAELNILDGVTSTAAELNILDGVTATAAEINLIDGGATIGTTALADGDGMLINDGGTMRVSTVQTVKTYMTDGVGGDPTGESSVSTLPTNAGTITFGSIPDGIKWVRLLVYDFNMAGSNSRFQVRLGDSGEIHSADNDYQSYSTYVTGSESSRAAVDGFDIQYYRSENSSNRNFLIFNLYKQAGTNIWISNHTLFVRNGSLLVMGAGVCTVLDSRLTQLVFKTTGNNFSAGNANIQWGY